MKTGVDIGYIDLQKLIQNNKPKNRVCVAVLDTGVDFSHDALCNAMWLGSNNEDNKSSNWNYIVDSVSGGIIATNKAINNQHGTMCAGLISGYDRKTGFTGVAAKVDVKLISINILDSSLNYDQESVSSLIVAIKFAEKNSAKVCNISSSTEVYSKELEDAIRNSTMLFVVSAGNSGVLGVNIDKKPLYPAAFDLPNVITVANLAYNGELNWHSDYGPNCVDLAAPGTCIYTTTLGNKYTFATGTSLAAPMVTATAALLYAYDDSLSAAEVKQIIMDSVDKRDALQGKVKSGGSLNAAKVVDTLLKGRV